MTDQEIVCKVLQGDRNTYAELVERHHRGLTCHICNMVKDAEVADDLAQDAFIKAYWGLKRYNPDYQFSTWIYRIATNLALDWLRKRRNISLDDIPEPAAPEDDWLKRKELAGKIQVALEQLSGKYQTVIRLHYWQGLGYNQMSEVMDVPIGTIKTWLYRAKGQLKEKLDGQI